jgi:glutamate-1-semialdehyde 2,1-aminomutase
MTGFRVALGGAQGLYGIKPDLTTLGKIIGGGLPVGAYGGRREIMELVAPSGPMYQAGTLSGNPLAMTAGYETLSILKDDPSFYKRLEQLSARLAEGVGRNIKELGLPLTQNRVGSMSTLFFTDKTVVDYQTAVGSDTKRFGQYFRKMLELGVYLAPSQFEAGFVSIAHTAQDIDETVAANGEALRGTFR